MKKETVLTIQAACAAATAYLSDRLGLLFPALLVLTAMMIVDYISGMAASKREAMEDPSKGWNSAKGARGILKKMGYLLVIVAGVAVDWLILSSAELMSVEIPTRTFFGLLVTIWYILNELLSITENAGRMGAPLPSFLVDVIAVLKDNVEHAGKEQSEKNEK